MAKRPHKVDLFSFRNKYLKVSKKIVLPISLTIKVNYHIPQFDQTQPISRGKLLINLTDLRFTHVYSCLSLEVLRIT